MNLIEDLFGKDGLFARQFVGYENRPEQKEMAKAVLDAFLNNKHIVIEAGTGVGKSFGYLIPAILSLNKEDRPIIISTNTINLQEQLIEKDLPWLRDHLGIPFTFALAKGRNNYISLRRMGIALEKESGLFDEAEEKDELGAIYEWSSQTKDGSKSNLPFTPKPKIWESVQSEADNCMGRKCPRYKDCFYYRARRELENVDIIVVNHALFFRDLRLRAKATKLLPDYKRVVFDEAHKLETVANDHLSVSLSYRQFSYLLTQIYNPVKDKGYFAKSSHKTDLVEIMQDSMQGLNNFFDEVYQYLSEHLKYPEKQYRLQETRFVDTSQLVPLQRLIDKLGDILELSDGENERAQIKSFVERIDGYLATILFVLFQEEGAKYVYWLEKTGTRDNNISLNASPIDVSEYLKESLFKKTPSVVMTSATICVDERKNFDFFIKRIGVEEPLTLMTGSPFDFANQVELHIPQNLVYTKETISNQTIQAIQHYVHSTHGGCLILFTSYSAMDQAFLKLQHGFVNKGYEVFCQGKNLSRSQMIQEFKKTNQSVLFGTDSFWEGVDIPGEALRNVIIVKLPFSVPSHPLTRAKYEYIESQGKSSFRELSLPEAMLKFKQGFGRLIRKADDKGIVCVLDTRVLTTPYGRSFLKIIPSCKIVYDTLDF